MAVTVTAYAKINWVLDVTALREDGYHQLDMLMQRIDLADEMLIEPARWLSLNVDGKNVPSGERNLVIRAARALNEFMGERRGARIRLKKRIPVRAGLGGGSADCAATLLALNRFWRFNLPQARLMEIGASLGSDVPYLLQGGFARVRGVGEELESLPGAQAFSLVLIRPGSGLSTPRVFGEFDRVPEDRHPIDVDGARQALVDRDLAAFDRLSGNALEPAALRLMPEIGRAMEQLRALGAAAVRMSGSGSTVFGVFADEAAAVHAHGALPGSFLAHTLAE